MTDKFNCPNKSKHVSAFPAYDRIECPYCKRPDQLQVYVKKEGEKNEKDQPKDVN